jgi:lipocalin
MIFSQLEPIETMAHHLKMMKMKMMMMMKMMIRMIPMNLNQSLYSSMITLVFVVVASVSAFCIDPQTAPHFNLAGMLGAWRQVYANDLAYYYVEDDTVCIQAHYGLNSNGTVSVNNTALIGNVNGAQYQILGWAAPRRSNPAELTVSLQGVPLPAPLWWLFTSSNATGRYEWAIGSDPLCATLFVLSRSWPIPKSFLPAIDAALAKHSWNRSQLVEIVWKGCPNV